MIYVKTLAVNKYYRFNDNKGEKRALRVYKWQQVDKNEDKKEWNLNKYLGNNYVLLLTPSQKELNHLPILGKRTRNLTHFIYIPKNY